ncbi:MAG: uroporphyrinogen decarboxylase family protein [Planctomycetota bacterium]
MAGSQSRGDRAWVDEGVGVIATWADFETYAWTDIAKADTSTLEWLDKNLPADMGVAASCHSVFEEVCWLMGYAHLCYQIYDAPDLVDAMFARIGKIFVDMARLFAQFKCVKLYFGGDDMGFKTGTMVQADILRTKCLPWHKQITAIAHNTGRVNVLHSCGDLSDIMDVIIDDVGYDAKHSWEDVILPVTEAKKRWGGRIGIVGGIDVDFLCRASEADVRKRVRATLDVCHPGGGYCLGSGNSVANYIPLDNYLAMLDEGRKYGG